MDVLVSRTLMGLGRLTIAFTLLDESLNAMVGAFDGVEKQKWARRRTAGPKILWLKTRIDVIGAEELLRPVCSWLEQSEELTKKRNRFVHTLTFEAARGSRFEGLVMLNVESDGRGNPKQIDPAELEDLADSIQELSFEGYRLQGVPRALRVG